MTKTKKERKPRVAPRAGGRAGMVDHTHKVASVCAFIRRHRANGSDDYAIALLLEKAGYTFRDLSDVLSAIIGQGDVIVAPH